jgi:Co/Zn/Cd efflux system component
LALLVPALPDAYRWRNDHSHSSPPTDSRYRKVLCTALGINLAMFVVEIVASIIAGSVSLRADALDFPTARG